MLVFHSHYRVSQFYQDRNCPIVVDTIIHGLTVTTVEKHRFCNTLIACHSIEKLAWLDQHQHTARTVNVLGHCNRASDISINYCFHLPHFLFTIRYQYILVHDNKQYQMYNRDPTSRDINRSNIT